MTKSTITRTWIAGLIVLGAGLVVGSISVGLLLAYGGTFTAAPSGNGYDFVPTINSFFWTTVSVMVLGFATAIVGGVVQLVAWVGALINTNRVADKTWFSVLLLGGLVGLIFAPVGFAAMVAYVLGGPDGMAVEQSLPQAPAPHPTTFPATS
jgi:hypothetical protein